MQKKKRNHYVPQSYQGEPGRFQFADLAKFYREHVLAPAYR
jgi:hypothetical protein